MESYVSRETKHIMSVPEHTEEEREEEREATGGPMSNLIRSARGPWAGQRQVIDVPYGDGTVCFVAPNTEKPIRDAMSGQPLGRKLVAIALQNELPYFLTTNAWLKRTRGEAHIVTGKRPFFFVKRVDVKKGYDSNPNSRSR